MTFRRSLLFVILCSFLLTGISAAQAFLFVSPNTREHMTNEFAWQSLDSFEQSNFLAVADYLTTRLCVKPQVHTAEGMDGNDTENSSLITGCSSSKARYVGELLGRYAHQKWILVFDPDPSSSERLLIATFSNDHPADVAKELRQAGINVGTIVPLERPFSFTCGERTPHRMRKCELTSKVITAHWKKLRAKRLSSEAIIGLKLKAYSINGFVPMNRRTISHSPRCYGQSSFTTWSANQPAR